MSALYIAVDPGFDSVKVVANGKIFKFPFVAEETDERKISDYGIRSDFLLYRNNDGTTYRVGQYARELIFDNKNRQNMDSRMNELYSEKRFISAEFQVGLRTAIGLAITENGLENDPNLEIFLMVALPHSIRQKYSASIKGNSAGEHRFSVQHGKNPPVNYHFTIREDHVFTLSQTISAILGETSDDFGNVDEEKFFYLSNGPTLVIDGGYYTTGLVVVSRGGSVDDDKTESDTEHAMRNVNEALVESIKDKRPDLKHYVLEYLLQTGVKIKYLEDGTAKVLDLPTLRAEKAALVCNSLLRYLDQKYDHLLDINYVLVTGGTGSVFFDQMRDYYTSANILDNSSFLLASSTLGGKEYSIEYAVAIGSYKGLKGKVSLLYGK